MRTITPQGEQRIYWGKDLPRALEEAGAKVGESITATRVASKPGFSGACKMLMPGLASSRTIGENHMQGVSPERYNYVGTPESPMRLDLEEGAGMLGKEIFIVNVVMNESLEICAFSRATQSRRIARGSSSLAH